MVRRVVSTGIVPGVVSGLVAGVLLLGVGGLVGMRLITFTFGGDMQFGPGGTIGLVLFGMVVGMIGGLLFQAGSEAGSIPKLFATEGATLGFALFVVLIPVAPHHLLSTGIRDGNSISVFISVFGLLFVGYGVVLDVLFRELCASAKSVRTEIS